MPLVHKSTGASSDLNTASDDDGVIFGRGRGEQRLRAPEQMHGRGNGLPANRRVSVGAENDRARSGVQAATAAPPQQRMDSSARIRSREEDPSDEHLQMRQALAMQQRQIQQARAIANDEAKKRMALEDYVASTDAKDYSGVMLTVVAVVVVIGIAGALYVLWRNKNSESLQGGSVPLDVGSVIGGSGSRSGLSSPSLLRI